MLDVILISPASRFANHFRPALSLIYLGGYLKHHGLKVKIIDQGSNEEILREIAKEESRAIGISCMSTEYEEVKNLISMIKGISVAKIIVGGVHPTLSPEDFFKVADIIVRGEGEVAMLESIRAGFCGVVTGKQYPLDEISFPDYSLVDMEKYSSANPYCIRGVFIRAAYIHASRGCPSSCSFCVAKNLRPFFGHGRLRSVENIWREVEEIRAKYLVDGFYIPDDLFTIRKDYVVDFCKRSNGMPWGCSAKVTTLDEETIVAMKKANCIQIDFGVERASDAALRRINKGQTVAQIEKIFSLCRKYGIRTFANFMIGLPEETQKDLDDIIMMIKKIRPSVVSVNVFQSYPGTDIKCPPASNELVSWARDMNFKHNSLFTALSFHLSGKYINAFLKSKRKGDYFNQLKSLIIEAMRMKGVFND